MFKGARRPGFIVATPLNTPIVMHRVGKPQHVSKDDVLGFLEKFITEKESIESVTAAATAVSVDSTVVDGESLSTTSSTGAMLSIDTNLSSAISQLKRVQRDFKGLPPLSFTPVATTTTTTTTEEIPATSVTTENGEETITTSATGGKKVTFD